MLLSNDIWGVTVFIFCITTFISLFFIFEAIEQFLLSDYKVTIKDFKLLKPIKKSYDRKHGQVSINREEIEQAAKSIYGAFEKACIMISMLLVLSLGHMFCYLINYSVATIWIHIPMFIGMCIIAILVTMTRRLVADLKNHHELKTIAEDHSLYKDYYDKDFFTLRKK